MSQELSEFAKKRKAKKVRRRLFLVILLVALLGTATYFVMENFFVVKEVSVKKSDIYESADILSCAGIKKGRPLYKINKEKIIGKIRTKFSYLEDIKISYKLPDKVQISFREEYGKFAVELGVEVFALDDDLYVLAKEPADTEIQRIRIISGDVNRCVVGENISFIDEDTAPILLTLIETLNEKKMIDSIRTINVNNQFDIRLDYDGRFNIGIGDHSDIPLKLAMLQKILEDLGSDASGEIDISDSDQAYVKLNDEVA
ncbi:MAG: FtsQ-type POTRA domain-containing protein [Clostridia bacterium]|nr:FtsQ-type POTRA domain-containing protein [Clostridia bacterium]